MTQMQVLRDQQFGTHYWDNASLPFLDGGNGDHIYLDLGGALANPGAVVDFNHERPATRKVLYGSVTEWLECFVDGLEGGLFTLAEGHLAPRDFFESGDFETVRAHDRARTNGRFPWTAELAMGDDVVATA